MEDTTPDFQDLLAAFDIPDMTVKISEVRSLAPVSTSSPCQTKAAVTSAVPATVKQEPDAAVNNQPSPWKPDEQGDCPSQPDKKLSDLGDLNATHPNAESVSQLQTSPASTSAALNSTLNGSLTNKIQSAPESHTASPVPSAQHARVVSSTLMANSWASTGPPPPPITTVTSPTISTALAKPSKVDKPSALPTSLIKFSSPLSSGSSAVRPPNSFTTAITASVYVNWVNTSKQSLTVPPLIVGSSPPRPIQSKISSILLSAPVNERNSRPCSSSNSTTLVFSSPKTQHISPVDILKRSNPIPKLHPTNGNIQSKIDIDGRVKTFYPCNECGDTYMVQSSLRMHMERRSVQISYSCPFCLNRRRLMFYNKCSFFAHLRYHCEQMKLNLNYITQACNASVSPLQYSSNSKRTHITTSNKTNDNKVDVLTENTSPSISKETVDKQETIKAGSQQKDSRRCPLCNIKLRGEKDVQLHMQRLDAKLVCEYCKMILPNKCQLNAHNIMHKGYPKGKWMCPECACQLPSYQMLSHHLSNSCMHWHHQVRIKCALCSRMVPNYLQHLDKAHEMLFYRCVSCSMAFKSLPSLKDHSEQKHQIQPGSPLCRIISKCPLCETVFMQKPLLVSHIKAHIEQIKPTTYQALVYSCLKCSAIMSDLCQFKKHLRMVHPNTKHCFCDFCRQNVQTFDNLKAHLGHQGSEACYRKAKIRKAEIADDSQNPQEPPKPSEIYHASNKEKSEGQPVGKLYVKKTRTCPGCAKDGKSVHFQKEEDLKSHMSIAHPSMELSSINSAECIKFTAIKETEELNNENSKSKVEKSRKRKGSRETAEELLTKKPKFVLPTVFICAKSECRFQSCKRAEFKTHIETHCQDASVPQCEECGMCFRVEASLKRHLFIQHMIKEYDTYIQLLRGRESLSLPPTENNTNFSSEESNKTPVSSSSTSSPVIPDKAIPLECQVCYKTFQNESTLRTHMRNHGMAFIRSKRSISND